MGSASRDRQGDLPAEAGGGRHAGRRLRRILVVTGDLGGGTGNHFFDLAAHWDRSFWRVAVLSQREPTARRTDEVEVVVLPRPHWYQRVFLVHIRNVLILSRYIRAYDPDVVHTYFFWPILYGRVLKLLGKIPALVENREDEGFGWSGPEYALLRLTSSRVDRIICVSEAVRRVVLRREAVDRGKTIVLHNGVARLAEVDCDACPTRSELGIDESELVVGMVANLNRAVKGVSYLLEAVPLVLEAVPAVRFLILGRGKLEESLRARAAELGVQDRVIFVGHKPDVDRYYAVMDVSVLTSLSEGLSITLLESMRHGLPVVVTEVGGNPEVVVDGETGFLVPPREARSFVDRLVTLLEDPLLRRRMGAAGRRRVETEFAIADVAAAYLRVYEELISQRKGGRTADERSRVSPVSGR